MPVWLIPLIEAGITMAKDYYTANEEEKAVIEARALTAIATMKGDKEATAAAHEKRTAENEARLKFDPAKVITP